MLAVSPAIGWSQQVVGRALDADDAQRKGPALRHQDLLAAIGALVDPAHHVDVARVRHGGNRPLSGSRRPWGNAIPVATSSAR